MTRAAFRQSDIERILRAAKAVGAVVHIDEVNGEADGWTVRPARAEKLEEKPKVLNSIFRDRPLCDLYFRKYGYRRRLIDPLYFRPGSISNGRFERDFSKALTEKLVGEINQ